MTIEPYDFAFEELKIFGEGVMACGEARLCDAGEGYHGEFFVSHVKLKNNSWREVPHDGALFTLKDFIIRRIASDIESSRTVVGEQADGEWAEHIHGSRQPDPDAAYEARRDMQVEAAE